MRTIYIVQSQIGRDLDDALRFGDRLQSVVNPTVQIERDGSAAETVRLMTAALRKFDPKTDHLLLMGDTVAILIAGGVVQNVTGGLVPCLKWDRRNQQYLRIMVDFNPNRKENPIETARTATTAG
jgi:hypothetical protein